MNGPPRLTERGGDFARVLGSAKRDAPLGRSRTRALAAVGVVAAATAPGVTAAASGSAAPGALAKWLLLAAIGGGGAVYGVTELTRSTPHTARTAAAASAPSVVGTVVSAASAKVTSEIVLTEPSPTPSSVPSPRPDAILVPTATAPHLFLSPPISRAASRAASPPHADLADEIAALDGAKRALVSGDADGALTRLDRYAHEFPRGALAQEGVALRIRALAKRGDHSAAVSLYRELAQASPSSPHLEPLRRLLELER